MAQDTNATFYVRFVATDRGVKAETRVNGKIAFPSNRGKQPQQGETWRVSIAGMNPRETVYFLKCIETVADSFAPAPDAGATASAPPQPASNQPRRDGKGNDQQRKGHGESRNNHGESRNGKDPRPKGDRKNRTGNDRKRGDGERRNNDRREGKDRSGSDAPRVWSFGSSTETPPANRVAEGMFVPDYLFAPGSDPYQQAKTWLTPVESINLANLKFATAQRAGFADADAVTIADALRAGIANIDDAGEHAATLTRELKGMSQNTRDVAGELVAAKKRFDAATEAKSQLQRDTLAYGRLVQGYKKQGKAEDAEANAHLAVVKGDLDTRRIAVNAEFEAAKNAVSDAEMARHFAYSADEVDRAIAVMADIERFESAQSAHTDELKATVKRYEDRIDAIRKSA